MKILTWILICCLSFPPSFASAESQAGNAALEQAFRRVQTGMATIDLDTSFIEAAQTLLADVGKIQLPGLTPENRLQALVAEGLITSPQADQIRRFLSKVNSGEINLASISLGDAQLQAMDGSQLALTEPGQGQSDRLLLFSLGVALIVVVVLLLVEAPPTTSGSFA